MYRQGWQCVWTRAIQQPHKTQQAAVCGRFGGGRIWLHASSSSSSSSSTIGRRRTFASLTRAIDALPRSNNSNASNPTTTTTFDLETARRTIQECLTSKNSVLACDALALYFQAVEYWYGQQQQQPAPPTSTTEDWIHNHPTTLASLLRLWKTAYERDSSSVQWSPAQLVQQLLRHDVVLHWEPSVILSTVLNDSKQLRQLLDDITSEPHNNVRLDTECYNLYLQSLLRNNKNNSDDEVEAIMEGVLEEMVQHSISFDSKTLRLVWHGYRGGQQDDPIQDALRLLQSKANNNNDNNSAALPIVCWTQAAHLYAQRKEPEEALKILLDVIEQAAINETNQMSDHADHTDTNAHDSNKSTIKTIVNGVKAVLDYFEKELSTLETQLSQQLFLVKASKELHRSLEQHFHLDNAARDEILYCLMKIYRQAKQPEQVEDAFRQSVFIGTPKYSMVIQAYCDTGQLLEAQRWLERLLRDPRVQPTLDVFHMVLKRCREWDTSLNLLRTIDAIPLQPTFSTYALVLSCLTKSLHPEKNASRVLELIETILNRPQTLQPIPLYVWQVAMEACAKAVDMESAQTLLRLMEERCDISLTTNIYKMVLNTWAETGTRKSAEQAEELLNTLWEKEETSSTTHAAVLPDAILYTTVMKAWGRSGDAEAGERAWQLLQQLLERNVTVDDGVYTCLLQCLCETGQQKDMQRAVEVMETMKQSNMEVGKMHHDTLLKGWAKAGKPEKATCILGDYVKSFVRGNKDFKPTKMNYRTVVQAWIDTDDLEKGTKVMERLALLHQKYKVQSGPDLKTLEMLLLAWDQSRHDKKHVFIPLLQQRIHETLRTGNRYL